MKQTERSVAIADETYAQEKADGNVECKCEVDGHYIGYIECMTGWCRHWASDRKLWEDEE